jgi:hypothetical protein
MIVESEFAEAMTDLSFHTSLSNELPAMVLP